MKFQKRYYICSVSELPIALKAERDKHKIVLLNSFELKGLFALMLWSAGSIPAINAAALLKQLNKTT